MPKLLEYSTGTYIPIHDQFTIGRSLQCSYVIEDLNISRKQCIFTSVNDKWFITDTSTNGVYINDHKIVPNLPAELNVHDILEFSTHLFGFKIETDIEINNENVEIIDLASLDDSVPPEPVIPVVVPDDVLQPDLAVNLNPCQQSQLSTDLDDELSCSICTELFINAVTLNCQHTYCQLCIFTWRKNNKNCPICRHVITSQNPSLTINNLVTLVVSKKTAEEQNQRRETVTKRQMDFEAATKPVPSRGRRRSAATTRASRSSETTARTTRHRAAAAPPARGRGFFRTRSRRVINIPQDIIDVSDSPENQPDDNYVDGIATLIRGFFGGR